MGEYATRVSDKQSIKIGTCENMYYLRWEDRFAVIPKRGSVNPAAQHIGLRFRVPLPSEDHLRPGDYDSAEVGCRLTHTGQINSVDDPAVYFDGSETEDSPGTIQIHHAPTGILINLPCYHQQKLPEVTGLKLFFNGQDSHPWELAFIKSTPEGLLPVVRCRHCGEMFRSTWAAVLPFIRDTELRQRCEVYAETAPTPVLSAV